jgi:uncharacterized membrane protein HdeD (DUF308 family)
MTNKPSFTSNPWPAASRAHSVLFFADGLCFICLGIVALALPLFHFPAGPVFGWLLLISGVIGFISAFLIRQISHVWGSISSACVAIALGAFVVFFSSVAIETLTYLMAVFFFAEGIVAFINARPDWKKLGYRAGYLTYSGAVHLVIPIVVLIERPASFGWGLPLMLGINLIFGGVTLITMSLDLQPAKTS